ncbi:ABC transporter permease [Schinkia azotoformans]|uniref:ABC transporter permease n=1 Tax=Schinkia azotoformans TaxID=1454 RepID=UPI002DBBFA7B|nr:ABC transporter permease [Schinkia azotoformans]MEC1716915.1 ABC transporter permease [Schinkia azotoformans]MEC1743197.1 ABC transporter permease [Schinkia azotoformans]MEC1767091.1 ABC transporter permease [Schinkia azotoformans]MEC1786643.1 ABC transporter permease [Schinkia azotoformans]MED4374237.1 ABC transporter permease [Schinkia azotoformans]
MKNLLVGSEKKKATTDIIIIIGILLLAWQLLTQQLGLLSNFLYPSPQSVLGQFKADGAELLVHLVASVKLLASGMILAIVLGVPLGVFTASNKRLEFVIRPIASVLSPIPPIVWIPYAIAILPSFQASSTFVIFIGAFWPIFLNTLNGVTNIDSRYIKSAQTLGLNQYTMTTKIIIPAALPSIFSGVQVGLVLSFILLTAAEMIGSSAGIGFYVKLATDYGNYTKVITGIIFIGLIVTVIMTLFHKLEKHLLRWRS